MYKESDHFIRFESQIEEFFDTLERRIDYAAKVTVKHDIKMKRKHLYGWDFNDLTRRQYSILHRMAQRFWEIIWPGKEFACTRRAKLPRREHYLASSSDDIKNITIINRERSLKLCTGLISINSCIHWHAIDKTFNLCKCHEVDRVGHSDFVQTLLPSRFRSRGKPERIILELSDNSAVTSGHNYNSVCPCNDERVLAEGYHPLFE